MKHIPLLLLASFFIAGCSGQQKTSGKAFDKIALVNRISFLDPKYNQAKFGCGFLLKYQGDTFAVTAKHLLKFIKPDKMKGLYFKDEIKSWSMYPLDKSGEIIITGKLLNENEKESLDDKLSYNQDWLLFSIKENRSRIKPLEIRNTALIPGEKMYVVGWTRTMTEGAQRVYEFEYYKTIDNRILLKEVIVPEKFGGLSGSAVLDELGLVVGLVSNSTTDPVTGRKYFSPCSITGLTDLIKKLQLGK